MGAEEFRKRGEVGGWSIALGRKRKRSRQRLAASSSSSVAGAESGKRAALRLFSPLLLPFAPFRNFC